MFSSNVIVKHIVLFLLLDYTKISAQINFGTEDIFKETEHNFPGPSKIPCPLSWIPGFQDGDSPDEYIVAFNTEEIVVQVQDQFFPDKKIVGRLCPETGLAMAASTISSDTDTSPAQFSSHYEVLTNPLGCILDWVEGDFGKPPKYAVGETENQGIGRGYFVGDDGNMNNVGGSVFLNKGLVVAFQGKRMINKEFQVLTSTYPLLSGHLHNFTYFYNDGNYEPNFIEVVESEIISKTEGEFELVQQIQHSGSVEETLYIREQDLQWTGIGKISYAFTSPFGGVPFFSLGNVDIQNENNFAIMSTRMRALEFKRDIKLASVENGTVKICSVARMLKGKEIEFDAMARIFVPKDMTDEIVKSILETSGRYVIGINGNEVMVLIKGFLGGNLLVEKKSKISTLKHGEDSQSCYKIFN